MKMLSVFFGTSLPKQKWRGISPPFGGPGTHIVQPMQSCDYRFTIRYVSPLVKRNSPAFGTRPPAELAPAVPPHGRNCGASQRAPRARRAEGGLRHREHNLFIRELGILLPQLCLCCCIGNVYRCYLACVNVPECISPVVTVSDACIDGNGAAQYIAGTEALSHIRNAGRYHRCRRQALADVEASFHICQVCTG